MLKFLPQVTAEKFAAIKMQMLEVYKDPFLLSVGKKHLRTYQLMRNFIFLIRLY